MGGEVALGDGIGKGLTDGNYHTFGPTHLPLSHLRLSDTAVGQKVYGVPQ